MSTVELAGVSVQVVLHCTDEAQLGRNSCLQLAHWHHSFEFYAFIGGGALLGGFIIPADSMGG